jgi:hypothetical protein
MSTKTIGGSTPPAPSHLPQSEDLKDKTKPSAEKVAAGVGSKATPKMMPKEMVMTSTLEAGRAPSAPSVQVTPQAAITQLNTPEALINHFQAFSSLAAGLSAPPSGVQVAERFGADLSFTDAAPLTTFVPGALFSAVTAQHTLPKDHAARANAVLRMMVKHEPATAAKQLQTLSPEQQAAVKHLSQLIKPTYGKEVSSVLKRSVTPAERRALKAEQGGSALAAMFGVSSEVTAVSSREQRDSDQPHAEAADVMQAYVRSDILGPIVLPGPQLVAIESSAADVFKRGLSLDIDGLVQMVLMESSAMEDKELMDLISDVKEQNRKLAKMRDVIAAQNKNKEAVKVKLREAYDTRTRKPKDDPLYIDPERLKFEEFCASQKIKVNGSMNVSTEDLLAEGASVSGPTFEVSPNVEMYASELRETISDEDIAWARALGITPQQLQALHGVYNDSTDLKEAHGDFATFLARAVGLSAPPQEGVRPGDAARDWLQAFSPAAIAERVGNKYNLNPAQVTALYEAYKANTTSDERKAGFEEWIRTSGIGLVEDARGVANQGKIDAYFAAQGIAVENAALMSRFGVTQSDIDFLKNYYDSLSGTLPPFEEWLSSRDGPRLREGESNHSAVRTWAAAEVDERNLAQASASFPVTVNGRTYEDSQALVDAVSNDPSVEGRKDILDALASAWGFQDDGPLDSLVRAYVDDLLRKGAHDNDDFSAEDMPRKNLLAFIDALPPEQREAANTFVACRLQLVTQELSLDLGAGQFITEGDKNDNAWLKEQGLVMSSTDSHENCAFLPGYSTAQFLNASDFANMRSGTANGVREFATRARQEGEARTAADDGTTSREVLADYLSANLPFPWAGPTYPPFLPPGHSAPLTNEETLELRELERLRIANGYGSADDFFAVERSGNGASLTPEYRAKMEEALAGGYDAERYWELRHRYAEHGPQYELVTTIRTTATIAETAEARAAREATEARELATIDTLRNVTTSPEDTAAAAGRVTGITEVSLGQIDARIEELQGQKETISALNEEKSLKLQLHMDRRAKLLQTLSNVMKKVSDVQAGIIGNLK